ncbi:endolytic peptidoglycan transglycosylase RlpA [Campylobacterota bacterium]|nr:endolytic peptidoglycan transglycosylase RlpA [Campylobacterota bacterium]
MRAIVLLSTLSLLFLAGCSAQHQKSASVSSSYYPGTSTAVGSRSYYNGGSSNAKLAEPTRADGTALMHRATLRGYTAVGRRYYPQIRPIGWNESGVASWYGPDFHGKKTSSGETYDMYAPGTAAHKTLPMNTIVLVTNKNTGAQIKVRINDRGPFVSGRVIDLSFTAGKALGLDKTGTAPVTVKVIEYDNHISAQLGVTPRSKGTETAVASNDKPVKKTETKTAQATPAGNYLIQLGSFRNLDGASKVRLDARVKAGREVSIQTVDFGKEKLHRVLIGGFDTKEEAAKFKDARGFASAVVVGAS